jgi:hypothetical protein
MDVFGGYNFIDKMGDSEIRFTYAKVAIERCKLSKKLSLVCGGAMWKLLHTNSIVLSLTFGRLVAGLLILVGARTI